MIKLARSLVLPLALTTALFACDKGKSGSGGGGGATGTAGASAIAPAKGLKSALAAMPKETEMILGLDFAQLRKSALWKQYEPKLMENIGKDLEEFKALCGFDPKEKLTGVLFGGKFPMGGGDMQDATIFVRGFAKSEVVDCLKKAEAKMAEKGNSARVDGNYIELSKNGQAEGGALFVDDATILVVISGGKPADKAGLEAAAAAKDGDGLTSSGAFVALLDEVKTGSAMFFVMNGNAGPMAMAAGQLPFKMKALFGWTNVASGVDGELRVRMDTDKSATTAEQMFNTMGKQALKGSPFEKFLDKVKVTSKGADMITTFKFDQKMIEELIQTAQSM